MYSFYQYFFTKFFHYFIFVSGFAGIFIAPKPNMEWGKIMNKATYNLCHPCNNIREDERNNYKIL